MRWVSERTTAERNILDFKILFKGGVEKRFLGLDKN